MLYKVPSKEGVQKEVTAMWKRITNVLVVLVMFLLIPIAIHARLTSGSDSKGQLGGAASDTFKRVKDYDADPSLKMRPYNELREEIRENITKIAIFPEKKKRIVIYIWDFDNKSGYRVGASKIKDDISTMLLEMGRFRLIDDAVAEMALREMNLSGTALIDQSNIKEFGKRIGMDYLMYGSINNNPLVGDEPNISLVLKLIDVETTEIVWSYEIGLNRRDFKTSLDAVIERGIYKGENSLAKEWDLINKEAIDSYGRPITSISVFFVNSGTGIDDSAAVDKMISSLIQAKIPGVRVIDRANLSRIIEQIKREGYEESAFYRTKKEFGRFYSVDAFLLGTIVKNRKTGKTELNLKLAMVESVTVDWGKWFESEMTPTERESIGRIQQKEFSESISKKVETTVGAVGEVLGFVLSSPGMGITLGGGFWGGFTTPGMTSKDLYNGNDLFKDQFQLLSFNLSVDFLRIRFWKHLYLETGFKFWMGSYTTPEDGATPPFLVSATFGGRLPSVGVRYVGKLEDNTKYFVKGSILPLIGGISVISSEVSYVTYSYVTYSYGYYYYYATNTIETTIPHSSTILSPLNWPLEFEAGIDFVDSGFYWSVIFGFWLPNSEVSGFEWELGFNIKIPIFWWHPFSFLYDKYLWE